MIILLLIKVQTLICPFVDTADIEIVVMVVTTFDKTSTPIPSKIPACPTTHVRRRNNITPQMFRRHLMYTPSNQPNLSAPVPSGCSSSSSSAIPSMLILRAFFESSISSSSVGRWFSPALWKLVMFLIIKIQMLCTMKSGVNRTAKLNYIGQCRISQNILLSK